MINEVAIEYSNMKLLETPFLVEIFFAISTIIFVATLYAILPSIVNKKRVVLTKVLRRWMNKNISFVNENGSKFRKKKEIRIPSLINNR